MKPAVRRLCALLAVPVLLAPATGAAESRLAAAGAASAGASLDFRIVIPPVMRVLENSHPPQLSTQGDGALGGEQRLVVLSNLRSGFCVALRLAQPAAGRWQLDARPEPGITLQPAADGYRLCSTRPGRHTLLLQHRFAPEGASDATGLAWPVQTDITAI
jgi:hypothetical protein